MPSQIFTHLHRVTYAECTLGNHVYYARYLDLLEKARGEFFRALGMPFQGLQESDTIFPVIECQVFYRAPARYDDLLRVEVWIKDLGRARLSFGYRVTNQAGKLILEATTAHVCASTDEKPKRLPADLARLLES